jgi:hypothetical protein
VDTATFLYSDWRGDHDTEWAHKFYMGFARDLGNAINVSFVECRKAIERQAALAKINYEKRVIQPIAFATASYLSKHLTLLASSDCEELKLKYILGQICIAFAEASAARNSQIHDVVRNEVLRQTRYQFLTEVWRTLIGNCFYEYKPYRELCIYKSNSIGDWQNAMIDLYPRLILVDIGPIYETSFKDELNIGGERLPIPPQARGLPVSYIAGASFHSNVVLTPAPLYRKTFTPAEIAVHREEKKVIDETVANISALVTTIKLLGFGFLDRIHQEVLETGKKEGYLQAQQKIITEQVLRMRLPAFIANEWKAEVSQRFKRQS